MLPQFSGMEQGAYW